MKSLFFALLPLYLIAPALGAENPAEDSRLYDPNPMAGAQKFEKKPPDESRTFLKPKTAPAAPAAPAAAPATPAPKSPVRVIPLTPAPSGTYEAPARPVTIPGAAKEQAPGYLPLPSMPAAADRNADETNEPSKPADLASGSAKVEELPTGPITLYAAGNYRLRRGAWGRIQLIIPKGKTFQLLRKEGEWYVVSYNGKIGYVHERGITHPLAEAVRKQQGLNALRRNEAAEIAACLAQVKEPAQIPELEDVLKGIQSFIAKDPSEIIPPAPPTRPNRVNPGTPAPASRPPATVPNGAPIGKTTPPTPPSADDPLLSPIKGRNCTTGGRRFGCYKHPILGRVRFHSGIDLQAPSGTPLVAPADGCTLIDQRDQKKTGGYGHQVRLQCGSRVISYSHLSRFAPEKRQYAKGETVAYVGSTGLSSGPHLHLEVLEGGHRIDPAYAFGLNTFCPRVRPENKRATGCGRARNPIRQRSSR